MGLFKKKIDISYIPVFKTNTTSSEYDQLVEAYVENKNNYIQTLDALAEKRELILQLQNKIYALQEELIAKNKIIQGMDKTD